MSEAGYTNPMHTTRRSPSYPIVQLLFVQSGVAVRKCEKMLMVKNNPKDLDYQEEMQLEVFLEHHTSCPSLDRVFSDNKGPFAVIYVYSIGNDYF